MSDDLQAKMDAKIDQLDKSLKGLRASGNNYAEAERDYKILLHKEALRLRDQGMAIGMIDKVIYGIPSIAQKRFLRDTAEIVYKANLEAINTLKLEIRILDSQIEREWRG